MTEISPLRRAKLATRFAQHDVDGDGMLAESDYRALAARLADLLGADAGARDEIAAGFADQWQQLCAHADIDSDGRISLDEYTAAMGGGIAGDSDGLDRAVLRTGRAAVRAADANGDGYLDLSDLQRLGEALRVPDAAGVMRALDTDGDGRLSTEEIQIGRASWRE